MSRTRRGKRGLPPRAGWENRHCMLISQKNGVPVYLLRSVSVLGAYCDDCGTWDAEQRIATPRVLEAGWFIDRTRRKRNGAAVERNARDLVASLEFGSELDSHARDLIAFLEIVADNHQWETGHRVWTTRKPWGEDMKPRGATWAGGPWRMVTPHLKEVVSSSGD